ncbi:WRKY DNA-binding protein 2, ARABIDOPSIS THALIANA WRKY DNA-BINDING PROTEIN 2 [Hibiscus trionum]|uniref:WRKY DNA-binding protein 2, ARABIDOPSIS THALIANA WRKY DNA-BINDING PROTEIN 2 n=1 Tax=Hibiscus trionum TaxID=183268 RepID=A0A9W7ISG3_HIBTR|nr:WRKY DNA-binding protein 2, ARABIDOPSIS THALIANA WRKY DNA-BINDING PROTEIN 2 [Hibiscus trionum]
MAGIDDNVSIIGDWILTTPSPRTYFTAMLGDNVGSKPPSKAPAENKTEGFSLGSRQTMTAENSDNKGVHHGGDSSNESESMFEQKSSSRGGLVERMAARAGFNAPRLNTESIRPADPSLNPDIRSPYLTIPPGLSPTTLLESPVFVSNSLAQPSPTTGKFPFIPNVNDRSCNPESYDKSENYFEDINATFAFKPAAEPSSSFFLGAMSKQSFPNTEASVQSERCHPSQSVDPRKLHPQSSNMFSLQGDFSRSSTEKDTGSNNSAVQRVFDPVGGSVEHSLSLDEPQDEGDQRVSGEAGGVGGAPSEDGYNWRKYGQKQVKGSEYPRSYYKCTHPTCQVKKKVERSHEGHITEIIYKGAHNHPKPPPNRRSSIGSSNLLSDMQLELPEQTGLQNGTDGEHVWATAQKGTVAAPQDWAHDHIEMTSSATISPENGIGQAPNTTHIESGVAVDVSSTFSNDEDEDDRGTHGSVSLVYDGEGDESESKRRKIEAYATEMSGASRAIREPRVVVQTTSEVDILDDGYRWRKYGQKVVKGNPNPRSYYKCTSVGCTVRKHVERASHDLKSVITTYEGKHNHDVPAARNSSHVNSATSNTATAMASSVQTHAHRPEPSQLHNSMVRPTSFGPFTLPGRHQLGPSPGFSFGMNQPGLANLAMAGLGPGQPKLPVLPIHPFMAHQGQSNEMGFRFPKGEAKMEPMSEPGLDLSSNTSVYQQLMSRLPLGPQM